MGRDGRGVKAASASSIEITFQYQGIRCRERIPLKPTPANLRRAEQHKAAIEHAIATGTFDYAATFPKSKHAERFNTPVEEVMSVETWLGVWLERKRAHLKSSTLEGYKKMITGQLVPALGNVGLTELRRKDVREWLSALPDSTSNKRLANLQSCLRSALDDAVEDELIDANPLAGYTYSRKGAAKTKDAIDPFDAKEQAAILAALSGQGRNLIQFAFWTGLRTSELIALEWGDVDWLNETIHVSRAQTQAADEPEVTKTRSGNRAVKLLGPAMEALKAQKLHTWLAGGRIFHNPRKGEPWDGDGPIRKTLWIPALRKAKVRYRYQYQTRHTFASMMLSAGEHPMWVAKQMGHSDWLMIGRVYGRWMPSADSGAGSKAEALFADISDASNQ